MATLAEIDSSSGVTSDTTNPNVLVKHLLPHEWTLWCLCDIQTKGKAKYPQNTAVYNFNTVEDFWAMYNNLKKPSEIAPSVKTNIIFLRKDVKPEWEDTYNKDGGEWIVDFEKSSRSNGSLDKAWENTLLNVIGSSFKNSDDVAAIWLQIRPKGADKISLWNKTAQDETICVGLGDEWAAMLENDCGVKKPGCGYFVHADSVRQANSKGGSFEAKPKHTINAFRRK